MNFNNKIVSSEKLYEKAYFCKSSMDRSFRHFSPSFFTNSALAYYKDFLQAKKHNSVTASIAMRDVFSEHPIVNPETYEYNRTFLEKDPEIDCLIKECNVLESKNYSKTKKIRNKIIKNNRINLYSVTPKMTIWEKFCFSFK